MWSPRSGFQTAVTRLGMDMDDFRLDPQEPMALRKRRGGAVGSPSSRVGGDGSRDGQGGGSLKFVLFGGAVAIVLLVFAVNWRREEKGSCRLCLRGDGLVREFRDGDGGRLEELGFADEDDGEVVGRIMSHPQICPRLYHERQISRLDLMHALNNLLQGDERFTREEMDDLAGRAQETGSSFKKHFDPFTGNYDAEVLKAAAASRAKTAVFIDTVEGLEMINLSGRDDRLLGLILHLRRRLWIAIRQYKGLWYNFDSTKATPLLYCDGASSLHMFLDKVVEEGGVVVVVLKPPPVAPIMLAQRPPPSITDLEYWKNWLFG